MKDACFGCAVPQPKGRRKRVRDERQQMLNKLAQIRYRCVTCHSEILLDARGLYKVSIRALNAENCAGPSAHVTMLIHAQGGNLC